jgi:lipopolysaccharide/colanic/teichoic acid biosynthesis glycosyltransferase
MLLPFLALVWLVIAIAIKADSPGPVFFKQRRMGHRGQTFRMVKFRSMYLRPQAAELAEAREGARTLDGDHRITRVGRILRKHRLDELPQVINILLGEMSWIGPRPEAVELSEWYHTEIPYYGYRHVVRPGITGWAQVNQGHVHDVDDVKQKLHYDFYYIKHFSAWLDLFIVLRTIKIALVGHGAR